MSNQSDHWEFYQDSQQRWRWSQVAADGKTVATSIGSYIKRSACVANARRFGFDENLGVAEQVSSTNSQKI